jgi:hypothetical protein
MGLSFHYKGRLQEAAALPLLVEEVEDICKTLGWKSKVFETHFPKHTFQNVINDHDYGIIFIPPECEPISLIFNSEGRLFNPIFRQLMQDETKGNIKVITVKLDLNDENPEPISSEGEDDKFDPSDFVYSISVKTQYAGAEAHITIIELLRYLSGKYLVDFEMMDESKYWDTKNPDDLHLKMDSLNLIIEAFNDIIKDKSIHNPKEFLSLIRMLKAHIKKDKDDESMD